MSEGLERIRFMPGATAELQKDSSVAQALRQVVDKAKGGAHAPGMTFSTIAGVSRRGAFAQLIMTGPRAIFVEFGTRKQKALAPLRNAIFGRRF